MALGDEHLFPGLLTAVLPQISFQSHRLLFSHTSAGMRGKNTWKSLKSVVLKRVQLARNGSLTFKTFWEIRKAKNDVQPRTASIG